MGTIITRVVSVSLAFALVASTFTNQPLLNDLLFRISVLIMLAQSWNLMANAGLVSLGHSAFFGVGSYAGMLAANALGIPLAGGLALAILCGAGLGILLAMATARLRGFFFAICTLGLSEGLRVTALMLPDFTGGAVGLFLQQQMRPSLHLIFFVASIGAVVSVLVAAWLTHTPFHYACRAMRNHESAAQMLGIDPQTYRFGVLALSGAMASSAGAITALYGGYIDPSIAFDLHITIDSQIAPILGGMYTVAGPLIGAGSIVVLSETTRVLFGANEGVSQLIFGAILVLGILFMPQGIMGLWTRWRRRHAPLTAAETAADKMASPAYASDRSGERADPDRQSGERTLTPLLSIRGLTAGYGESIVLQDVSLEVGEGEVVCLLGANGAGKTTTMAVLSGLQASKAGAITYDGRDITQMPSHQRVAAGIVLAPEGRKVFPGLTVEENLLLGGFNPRGRKLRTQKFAEVFDLFPILRERRKQRAGLMSGGEQQMLALGRALMANPRLLLLDEPSLGLAPKIVLTVFDAIRRIAQSKISILLVEQNAQAALSIASRGYVLSTGRIAHQDTADRLRDSKEMQEAFIGGTRRSDLNEKRD